MASITFWGNTVAASYSTYPSGINHAAGSGLGFYGAGYGVSVPVGQYQDSTWVTDSLGTSVNSYQLNNTKYITEGTTSYNNGVAIPNWRIPNYYAPLNIRFSHNEPVRVQNCKLRIFDRTNIQNQAEDVITKVYEVRHPNGLSSISGLAFRGEASHNWIEFDPADEMIDVTLTSSPGVSGLNTNTVDAGRPSTEGGFLNYTTTSGAFLKSTRHDWYIALSASPVGIGSKTNYGLYFTCEYL